MRSPMNSPGHVSPPIGCIEFPMGSTWGTSHAIARRAGSSAASIRPPAKCFSIPLIVAGFIATEGPHPAGSVAPRGHPGKIRSSGPAGGKQPESWSGKRNSAITSPGICYAIPSPSPASSRMCFPFSGPPTLLCFRLSGRDSQSRCWKRWPAGSCGGGNSHQWNGRIDPAGEERLPG